MSQQTETKRVIWDIKNTKEGPSVNDTPNRELTQTKYLCEWIYTKRCKSLFKRKIVKADNKQEAIKKLLLNCDESFEVIINVHRECYHFAKYLRQRDDFLDNLVILDLLPKILDQCYNWDQNIKSIPEFTKKYHKFLEENLDNAVYIFQNCPEGHFTITNTDDKNLLIE